MQGFTLIELLISTTLSLLVLAIAMTVYANSQHSYRTQSLTRQIQENGRFALQIIGEDLRMAKYLGSNINPESIVTEPDALSFKVCGEAGWGSRILEPIFASNNTNPYSESCIPAANYKSSTDVLVVRRVDSEPVPTSGIRINQLYLYTSLMNGGIFLADDDGAIDVDDAIGVVGSEQPVSTHKISANAYYIRPCSDAGVNGLCGDAADDAIPTLVREKLTANGAIAEPLVEFVESMQIRFGVDINSDFTIDRYVDADDVSDWDMVMAVRLFVLIRSPDKVTAYVNNNKYVFGDENFEQTDGYYRKLFAETLFLRNPGMDINLHSAE
jgi:type IV pilus assembly protein PilW